MSAQNLTRIRNKGGVRPTVASLRGRIAMAHRWGNLTSEQIDDLSAELDAETLIDRVEFLVGQYLAADPPPHHASRVAEALDKAANTAREAGAR